MQTQEPRARAEEARSRWFALWDGYLAVAYGVTVVWLFLAEGPPAQRAVAAGALTAMIPWYAAVGRRPIVADTRRARSTVFVAGLLVLFAVVTVADAAGSFALFAVAPLIMMSLRPAVAIPLVLLAHLWPIAVAWARAGTLTRETVGRLPALLLGAAVATFIGLFIARVIKQSRERAELIEQLHRSREREARLSHEAGIAAERERLAREIHDTLAQSLTSISALAQAADAELERAPERARDHLGLVRRVADESLAEARAFVADRMPPALGDGGLATAVRRQTETVAARTGLEITCRLDGEEVTVPTPVAVVLLRSVQEALSNVGKHADARHVDVVATFTPGTVGVTVVDDGRGFDPSACDGGYGLHGMRSRAADVGGRAEVHSGPDGTRVEVSVPVDHHDERRSLPG